jgi:hypothetical protein
MRTSAEGCRDEYVSYLPLVDPMYNMTTIPPIHRLGGGEIAQQDGIDPRYGSQEVSVVKIVHLPSGSWLLLQ